MINLIKEIESVNKIAIAGHVRPDGDCVGSCMGLYNYILDNYPQKEVSVYLERPSEKFDYIQNIQSIKQETFRGQEYELFIVLDCGDLERIGFAAEYFKNAKRTICIDHHISTVEFADENCIIRNAAATCEILFDLLLENKISKATAEALYTGVIHDTGVLKHSNTTPHTMQVVGALMSKGVPFTKIINESFYQKTYVQNQILGRALLESVVFYHGTCIFTALRRKDLEFYGVADCDLDGIVDQLIVTKGVECAIFMYEIEAQKYKVSLRSKNQVDVSKIATRFGGGGHIRAAGCTMMGSIYDAVNNISCEIAKQMPGSIEK